MQVCCLSQQDYDYSPVKVVILYITHAHWLVFAFCVKSNVWDQFSCSVARLTGLKLNFFFLGHFLGTFPVAFYIDEPLFYSNECNLLNCELDSGTCSQRTKMSCVMEMQLFDKKSLSRMTMTNAEKKNETVTSLTKSLTTGSRNFILQPIEDDGEAAEDRVVRDVFCHITPDFL